MLFAGFLKANRLDMIEVPYREDNLAIQDLAKGRIQVNLSIAATVLPQLQAGNVQLLAVTNHAHAPLAPNVPTVAEAEHPELDFEGSIGFVGSRGISDALRNRIAADVRAVADDPAFAPRLATMWEAAHATMPAEFAAAIEDSAHRRQPHDARRGAADRRQYRQTAAATQGRHAGVIRSQHSIACAPPRASADALTVQSAPA